MSKPYEREQAATPLFSEFPATTYEAWRQAIDKMLKGAPFEKKLVTQTYEGIDLQPLYRQADIDNLPCTDSLPGFPPYLRGAEPLGYKLKPWDVCQELSYRTPGEFNQALRADLERGQNAVNLVLDKATLAGLDADQAEPDAVGQGGVSLSSLEDLKQALDGVDLEQTPIFIQSDSAALPIAALLAGLVRQQGKDLRKLRGAVSMDPLGVLARDGALPGSLDSAYDAMAPLTGWARINAPQLQTIGVQGHPYHNGGATATQELAFALAAAVEYLRALQARGLDVDAAAPGIRFAFSLGSNIFMEIARMRAARMLWAKIVKAFGGSEDSQKMAIHARTSAWNKTVYDPYVNMLRATTEAFAGVVGGCDSLHIGPFDEVIRTPDEFSRRIARNVHIILREECNIPRTVDPAGGSWYVEALTDAVARKTWELFQAVEKQGGLGQALQAGFPQQQITEVAAQRAANAARRRDIFVGVNMYANVKETPLAAPPADAIALQSQRIRELAPHRAAATAADALKQLAQGGANLMEAAIAAAAQGATLGELATALGTGAGVKPAAAPIPAHRGAEPFEALRKAAEAYVACTGAPPKVFLANMGPFAQHKARADFARGLLEVAAFDVIYSDGFDNPEQAADAALAAGAPAVVICSTDATYPELVPALTQRLKAANPNIAVLVAGYPKEHVAAFKAAGVDDFIYTGANCLELLRNLQQKTGVTA